MACIGFEYEDDDYPSDGASEESVAYQVENLYYEADEVKNSDPRRALGYLDQILDLVPLSSPEREWRFKAVVLMTCLHSKLADKENVLRLTREVCECTTFASRAAMTDAFRSISESIDSQIGSNEKSMLEIYKGVSEYLWSTQPGLRHIWYSMAMRCCRHLIALDQVGEYSDRVSQDIQRMKDLCTKSTDSDFTTTSSQHLEVLSLELEYLVHRGFACHSPSIKRILRSCLALKESISNPRCEAVIAECMGKLFIHQSRFGEAHNEFFASFKAYSDTGNRVSARRTFHYLLMSNLYTLSRINPLDSREAKSFACDPEVRPVVALSAAFHAGADVKELDAIIGDETLRSSADEYLLHHLQSVVYRIKVRRVSDLMNAYRAITVVKLAGLVNAEPDVVRRMVMNLMLDKKIRARFSNGSVILASGASDVARVVDGMCGMMGVIERSLEERFAPISISGETE